MPDKHEFYTVVPSDPSDVTLSAAVQTAAMIAEQLAFRQHRYVITLETDIVLHWVEGVEHLTIRQFLYEWHGANASGKEMLDMFEELENNNFYEGVTAQGEDYAVALDHGERRG